MSRWHCRNSMLAHDECRMLLIITWLAPSYTWVQNVIDNVDLTLHTLSDTFVQHAYFRGNSYASCKPSGKDLSIINSGTKGLQVIMGVLFWLQGNLDNDSDAAFAATAWFRVLLILVFMAIRIPRRDLLRIGHGDWMSLALGWKTGLSRLAIVKDQSIASKPLMKLSLFLQSSLKRKVFLASYCCD